LNRIGKKSDVSHASVVLAVTSRMSLLAVKKTVGPGEGGWGQSAEKEQHGHPHQQPGTGRGTQQLIALSPK
jgi:hypothetical protein